MVSVYAAPSTPGTSYVFGHHSSGDFDGEFGVWAGRPCTRPARVSATPFTADGEIGGAALAGEIDFVIDLTLRELEKHFAADARTFVAWAPAAPLRRRVAEVEELLSGVDHGSPITSPSMVCSCLIGSSCSTTRAGRCARASSGIDS
jgi:hypothetical protein